MPSIVQHFPSSDRVTNRIALSIIKIVPGVALNIPEPAPGLPYPHGSKRGTRETANQGQELWLRVWEEELCVCIDWLWIDTQDEGDSSEGHKQSTVPFVHSDFPTGPQHLALWAQANAPGSPQVQTLPWGPTTIGGGGRGCCLGQSNGGNWAVQCLWLGSGSELLELNQNQKGLCHYQDLKYRGFSQRNSCLCFEAWVQIWPTQRNWYQKQQKFDHSLWDLE